MKINKLVIFLIVLSIIFLAYLIYAFRPIDLRGGNGDCNDNYTGGCVPNVRRDIDCWIVGRKVTVIGKDVYNLDSDHNGTGCEGFAN